MYFLDAVMAECLQHTIQLDAGTENININQAMKYLSDSLPRITPLNFVVVYSTNRNKVSFPVIAVHNKCTVYVH